MAEINTQQHVLEQCLTLKSQLEALETQLAIEKDAEILATLVVCREQLVSKFNAEKNHLRVVSGLPAREDAAPTSNREHELTQACKLLNEKLNAVTAEKERLANALKESGCTLQGVAEMLQRGNTNCKVPHDIVALIDYKNRVVMRLEADYERLHKNHDDVLKHIGRGLSGHTYCIDGIPEGIDAAIKYKKDMRTELDHVCKERDEARVKLEGVTKERDEARVKLEGATKERDVIQIKLAGVAEMLDHGDTDYKVPDDIAVAIDAKNSTIKQLEYKLAQMTKERDEARVLTSNIVRERDVVQVKLEQMTDNRNETLTELEHAVQRYNTLAGERDELQHKLDRTMHHARLSYEERYEIKSTIADMERTIEFSINERDVVQVKLNDANQRCDKFADERDDARSKLESAETKCKHIMARCDVVESRMHEYAKMASNHEATLHTRNELITKITEELRNSSNQLIATTRERDGMIADVATLTQRLSELEKTSADLSKSIDKTEYSNGCLREANLMFTKRVKELNATNTYLRECVDKALKWMEAHPYASK